MMQHCGQTEESNNHACPYAALTHNWSDRNPLPSKRIAEGMVSQRGPSPHARYPQPKTVGHNLTSGQDPLINQIHESGRQLSSHRFIYYWLNQDIARYDAGETATQDAGYVSCITGAADDVRSRWRESKPSRELRTAA